MKLHNIRKTKTGYTTFGCMWKQGEVVLNDETDVNAKFLCTSAVGSELAMQSRVTAFWPDHSVKWTAHTVDAGKAGETLEVKLTDSGNERKFAGISLIDGDECTRILTENFVIEVPKASEEVPSENLFKSVKFNGSTVWKDARLVLQTAEPFKLNDEEAFVTHKFISSISKVTFESEGPIEVCVKFEGIHRASNGKELIPFIVRMFVGLSLNDIRFQHTFLYDGDENKDFLKGIGISLKTVMEGELFNRHVKFQTGNGMFHEALVHLQSWRPRVPFEYFRAQIDEKRVVPATEHFEIFDNVMANIPLWDEYSLCQDSESHFAIKKKLAGGHLCYIPALSGERTEGGATVGSLNGSTIFAVRDFWEKYPTGYTFKGLSDDEAECTMWFWSPEARPMDFRHYADRGYNQVCYEGYDYKGANPDGIACTNEAIISFREALIATDSDVKGVTDSLNAPALFVATPEFYHDMKAFGYWSLPTGENETLAWMEKELEKAFDFYKNEVKQRNWYGMFDYGDVMHSYDALRHMWKYDIGGYAWDNTELVPTLWLWLYFLRTGREDVFTFAEKMSRHASEVDVYHLGKYKGLGSRHNVRHWGCPCKEARIAMAHHHRYYYYLMGDRRLEDIFDELKDNELSFLNKDPLGDFFNKEDMVYPSHARSGPDWSSLVSNWMTEWERHDDKKYRDKILTGIADIASAPLKLSSGPDFEFDPETVHLRYIGERTTGGCHLQVCMGGPSIWFEAADLLENDEFKKMLADHGRFYFLPHEEQLKESGGIIGKRQSTLPLLATALGAYGAAYLKDEVLAKRVWHILLETMIQGEEASGFTPNVVTDAAGLSELKEIPWITTNFTAQWCLNAIMVPEFIKDSIPKTLEEVKELVADAKRETLHTS